jgi:hypothetical protein
LSCAYIMKHYSMKAYGGGDIQIRCYEYFFLKVRKYCGTVLVVALRYRLFGPEYQQNRIVCLLNESRHKLRTISCSVVTFQRFPAS